MRACFYLSLVLCSLAQPDLELLKNMTRTEDFLQLMRKNGRPVTLSEIINSDEAREHVGGELSMSDLAQYDYCSPRYQCVVIPRYTDPNVIYYPPCTRVLRCGGCAPSEVLTCAPKQTSVKHVVVFKSTIPYPGSPSTDYEGLQLVNITQHDSCEPTCTVKPYHCNPLQSFIARECRCMCTNRGSVRCAPNQVWDEDTCSCKCAQTIDNCPGFSRFSDSTCGCELRQGVSGMTDEEIRNLLELAAQVTTQAPTTAAPTLPPLVLNFPNAPCRPLVPCPAGTTPKISTINGRCQCMLQFSFPRLPQLRRRRQALERRRLLRNAGRV